MPNLAVFHLRDTTNIADRWCSLFDQLNWTQLPTFKVTVGDNMARIADYGIGIFGGGKILGCIAKLSAWWPKDGCHVRTSQIYVFHGRGKARRDVIGSRDCGRVERGVWAPYASAQPAFFGALFSAPAHLAAARDAVRRVMPLIKARAVSILTMPARDPRRWQGHARLNGCGGAARQNGPWRVATQKLCQVVA